LSRRIFFMLASRAESKFDAGRLEARGGGIQG
jgi:hypothetical protein